MQIGQIKSLDTALNETNYNKFILQISKNVQKCEIDKVPYKWPLTFCHYSHDPKKGLPIKKSQWVYQNNILSATLQLLQQQTLTEK